LADIEYSEVPRLGDKENLMYYAAEAQSPKISDSQKAGLKWLPKFLFPKK